MSHIICQRILVLGRLLEAFEQIDFILRAVNALFFSSTLRQAFEKPRSMYICGLSRLLLKRSFLGRFNIMVANVGKKAVWPCNFLVAHQQEGFIRIGKVEREKLICLRKGRSISRRQGIYSDIFVNLESIQSCLELLSNLAT